MLNIVINRTVGICVFISIGLLLNSEQALATSSGISIKRSFVDGPFGQIHIRIAKPVNGVAKTPIFLFHPTPYSSVYYRDFIPLLAKDRVVIAFDTPGYGDSTAPRKPQSITGLASAAIKALDELGYGESGNGAVDMLGYHTGTLIAAEVAIQRPDLARRLVLPGLAYFAATTRENFYVESVKESHISTDGSHLDDQWEFTTRAMKHGLTLEEAQTNLADLMQCYPQCWHAYHGVFTYKAEERFPMVKQKVLLISIDGSLNEETRAAKDLFSDAQHVYLSEVKDSGFIISPEKLAEVTKKFLD
ncbi:alpha/beta fold hydrolase [Sphingorhabdus sp. EL138]|uniref:alpha/beta fold hydrolase n=1 Tax=Sphingorhabdus sp. EL138 TaxID=2073156 RepID=UPI0013A59D0C|nr:alpha/beta hydrolase [Sphingorhabdus sp. EL138]